MGDGAALVRAILEHPDEDTPRLAFADWLQGEGDETRAEFIRRQIAGELAAVRSTWLLDIEAVLGCQPHQCRFAAEPWSATVTTRGNCVLAFRRGFVARYFAPAETLFRVAEDLFAAHPVENFVPSDVPGLTFRVVRQRDAMPWVLHARLVTRDRIYPVAPPVPSLHDWGGGHVSTAALFETRLEPGLKFATSAGWYARADLGRSLGWALRDAATRLRQEAGDRWPGLWPAA